MHLIDNIGVRRDTFEDVSSERAFEEIDFQRAILLTPKHDEARQTTPLPHGLLIAQSHT
jgi:hypothetical protein